MPMTDEYKRLKYELDDCSGQLLPYPVVSIAVGEDSIDVCNAINCLPVIVVLKAVADGAKIHGIFNDGVIIL